MSTNLTKYENLMNKVANLEMAMNRATNDSCKNALFLQAERLKYKASQMTLKEAMELV